jgi:hypothetical protein
MAGRPGKPGDGVEVQRNIEDFADRFPCLKERDRG